MKANWVFNNRGLFGGFLKKRKERRLEKHRRGEEAAAVMEEIKRDINENLNEVNEIYSAGREEINSHLNELYSQEMLGGGRGSVHIALPDADGVFDEVMGDFNETEGMSARETEDERTVIMKFYGSKEEEPGEIVADHANGRIDKVGRIDGNTSTITLEIDSIIEELKDDAKKAIENQKANIEKDLRHERAHAGEEYGKQGEGFGWR